MLCAVDEQSRTCWMTAFRLLKVYSKNRTIMKYYYNLKEPFYMLIYFKMSFIPLMATLNFQQSLVQSSVPHNPSEIILKF